MVEQKERKFIVYQITNKINKMIYIGVHVTNNVNDLYMGSGRNISKAIKKFGLENFEKVILFQFNTKEEMLEKEKELVNREFIARRDTYNIIVGGGTFNTIDTICVKDKYGNISQVHKMDPRYLSGELVSILTGKIPVKDIDGNFYSVEKTDPRYLSGEFFPFSKNMITVRDKNGKCMMINKDDPRYLLGELIGATKGYKVKEETLKRIKNTFKNMNHQKGSNNSNFGTCWIWNDKENKKIKKDKLDEFLKEGWTKGRKMNLK